MRRALPRAGSARRVLRAAAGAGPGGERRAAKRGLGPGRIGCDAAGDCARLPAPPVVLPCCWVHFVSCTPRKPCFTGAGRGPPRPGRRLEGMMLTRPRLGRCSPAHSAPELMVLVGTGAMHFGRGSGRDSGAAPLLSPGRRMGERDTLVPALRGGGLALKPGGGDWTAFLVTLLLGVALPQRGRATLASAPSLVSTALPHAL